ncbi:MAG TPA: metallophosphoesterase [Terriglobales bacterium]|nr:metallophosphoesterase [Terriglobales bacterium]
MIGPPDHGLPRRVFVLLLLIFVSAALLPSAVRSAAEPTPPAEVMAIADIHGDFDDLVALLQHAGLIDAAHHWSGGKTTLVQVGDVLDRGPKPRQAMDLLMALEKEAPKTGGQLVCLLGNHEVMNITGDLRYVTPENFASFATPDSDKRRGAAYQEYEKWRSKHSQLLAELSQPMELTEAEWMARHPAGFLEQREAFSPNGVYGKWLREHSAIAKIGDVMFLHGGLSPSVASLKLETINAHIRDEIKEFDSDKQYMLDEKIILPFFNLQEVTAVAQAEIIAERKGRMNADTRRQERLLQFLKIGEWFSVRSDGPLWFRGYDVWSDEEAAAHLDKALKTNNVAHIVVGHTVQKGGRVRSRFDNKVFLIDTGMLSSYYPGGRASALAISNGAKFTAEYMDQEVVLLSPPNISYLYQTEGVVAAERRSSCLDSSAAPVLKSDTGAIRTGPCP